MILLELGPGEGRARYSVAGKEIVTDPPLERLEPFLVPEGPSRGVEMLDGARPEAVPGTRIRRVHGVVGDRELPVEVFDVPRGYRLQVSGVEPFDMAVNIAGLVARTTGSPRSPLVVDTALGPVLAWGLARDGVWLLHSSAVARRGQAVAFVGPSGTGKTFLATHLGSRPEEGWQLLADDALPIRRDVYELEALPRFPQPRWSARQHAEADVPERLPLGAIVLLDRPGPDEPQEVHLTELEGRNATLAVALHSLGVSLFDEILLKDHFHFVSYVEDVVAVYRLVYPFGTRHLSEIEAAVAGLVERAAARPAIGWRTPRPERHVAGERVLAQRVGGELLLLHLDDGTYYALDPVGAEVWERLSGGSSLEAVVDALAQAYEVDRERLARDTERLAGELTERGLLDPVED